MNDLYALRRYLAVWGRLSRAIGIGYPTMSAETKAIYGRGGAFNGASLPDDIAELDAHISRCPPQHKMILVETYTKNGNYEDHAARLRISVDAFYRRRKRAEVYLNTIWQAQNC